MSTKFSQFVSGSLARQGDISVGLRDGANTQFDFPGTGICDIYGNQILGWVSTATSENLAANYVEFTASLTTLPAIISSIGSDTNVDLELTTQGTGVINLAPDSGSGFVTINDSQEISSISNDTSLSADSANILPTQQAVKTYVTSQLTGYVQSVTGTSNRITIGGTSANPTVDISTSYVGQSTITTLGTVSTGVWNGTLISATYGGTGVNNGSNTLTLAGSLATSGAYSSTFTMTGATSVTFPTSGTLATTTGTVTTATNLAGGASGSIPYQSAASTTAMLATATGVLIGGTPPSYTTTPTLTGTNFSGIPNSATTATNANTASAIVARDSSGNFTAGTITASLTGHASLDQTLISTPIANDFTYVDSSGQTFDSGISLSTDGMFTSPTNTQVPTTLAVYTLVNTSVSGPVSLQGNWDASSNTPTLTAGVGTLNNGYYVSVAGTQTTPSGTPTAYTIGDLIYYGSNAIWNKVDQGLRVVSLNGQSGIITGFATSSLSDVTEVSLADAQAFIYNSGTGQWNNKSFSGAFTITNAGVATLATVSIASGGTGQVTANAGFNALSPMTTAGDLIYGAASGVATRLATGSGVLVGGTTPSYSTTPTLTGTNFSGIPNSATTATNANTALAIVARDSSGNFTAGTITASLTGTASSATTATTSTNLAGGASGSIPYQTGSGATSMLATATGVLIGGTPPSYTTTPTLTGTSFTGIPLATAVTGTLGIGNGGTGVTQLNSMYAYNSVATTLATNGFTKVTLGATNFVNGTAVDTTNSKYLPLIAGTYQVNFCVGLAGAVSATGSLYGAAVYKNGSVYSYGNFCQTTVAGASLVMHGSTLIEMNGSTDYIELYGYNGNVSSTVPTNNSSPITYLNAAWVSQ